MTGPLDSVTTELTVAVALEDTSTGGPPRGRPRVELANAEAAFLRNPSGYHVLVDLPVEPSTLEIVVESELYLREERSVDRSSLDPTAPLVTVELVPGPAYPFGAGTTLVRGLVEDGGDPVPDAAVSYVQGSDGTRCNASGEFALGVTDFTSEDVGTDDDVRVVEPGGRRPTIEATHPDDGRTASTDVVLPVGGTASVTLAF